jgi:cytochrome c oxidase subunit II
MNTDREEPTAESQRMQSTKQYLFNLCALCVSAVSCMLLLFLAGCHPDHPQSAFHPRGPASAHLAWLSWFLIGVMTAVFVITMLLALIAITRARRDDPRPPGGSTKFIVLSGIVFPAVILVVLLFASLRSTWALRLPDTDLTIHIIGHQFWWEVHYPGQGIITANEFHIPVGRPVRLKLTSADVIHSLWVPNLTSKMDLLPERTNHFWIQSDEPGVFFGQCAEYCGVQHARMALRIVALEEEEFEQWLASRRATAITEQSDLVRRGRDVFFSKPAGCNACHAIRGTAAMSRIGPDLTHIGSRLTLGAGQLPNTREFMAAWILDSQKFKPGNLMPPTDISQEDLEALVEYMFSLK